MVFKCGTLSIPSQDKISHLLRFQPMGRVRMKNMRRRESGARKKWVLRGIYGVYEHVVSLAVGSTNRLNKNISNTVCFCYLLIQSVQYLVSNLIHILILIGSSYLLRMLRLL